MQKMKHLIEQKLKKLEERDEADRELARVQKEIKQLEVAHKHIMATNV